MIFLIIAYFIYISLMQTPFLTGKSDRKQKAKSLYSICTQGDFKMSTEYIQKNWNIK